MGDKDFYIIASIISMLIFAIMGFILGKYIIKTKDKKANILIVICAGFVGISIIYIASYHMILNLAQESIIRGFGGMPLGYGISILGKRIKA